MLEAGKEGGGGTMSASGRTRTFVSGEQLAIKLASTSEPSILRPCSIASHLNMDMSP